MQFQRIFGGNLVSETKFGYNQSNRRTLDTGPSPVEISITGFTPLTGPQEIIEGRTFSVLSDFAVVRGRHNVKFGGEIRRIFVDVGEATRRTCRARLRRTGRISTDRLELQHHGLSHRAGTALVDVGYIQDDVKWRSESDDQRRSALRVLHGARREGRPRQGLAHRVRRLLRAGNALVQPDYNNFGPRVGFAWAPARFNDNTVIRGGFGVFFGPGRTTTCSRRSTMPARGPR